MAVADKNTKVEEVVAVAKTPETGSNAEVSTPSVVDNDARPHITFKTKMALFVCSL